jgi:competence protein ComEC
VTERLSRAYPHVLLGALCLGVAAANLLRWTWPGAALLAGGLAVAAVAHGDGCRFPLFAAALVLAGLWWGSVRLEAVDRSVLQGRIGTAERSLVVVTGPARRGRFDQRLPAVVRRFGDLLADEPVLLELPAGRSPPQGAVLEVLGVLAEPRGPEHGFDERVWLRRHGVHAVLRGDRWRQVGRRTGLGGFSDRLRAWLARSLSGHLRGERRAVLEGVVLGEDQGLSDDLRQRFRASGLYHLLAVSGQNVALVAGGALVLAWLAGLPRVVGELAALASIGAYVLAVGAQPSVVRAGVAGALGSIAWLTARERDRWWFLLAGAFLLLAWNPYTLFDAGFQLSFAAVVAIFTLAPRLRRVLAGYPLPGRLADVVAISGACGLATAPVLWLQFGAVPLLSVPANALAAPAVVPLLGLSLAAASAHPLSPSASAALAWLAGCCAAYLAACARLVGSLPFAQVRSGAAVAVLLACALAGTAYAWRRWRRSSAPST